MASKALTLPSAAKKGLSVATPVAAGGLGALIGTLLSRWAAAKALPERYASSGWLAPVAGGVGAIAGGLVPLALMSSGKTKSAVEKRYKATYPLGFIGMVFVLLATTVGPRAWSWAKAKWPSVFGTANVSAMSKQLTAAVVGAPKALPTTGQTLALPQMSMARAGGLSPDKWDRLEERARSVRAGGLAPNAWDRLEERRPKPSPRWAE